MGNGAGLSIEAPSPVASAMLPGQLRKRKLSGLGDSGYGSTMSRKKPKPLPFNSLRFLANHLKAIREERESVNSDNWKEK